MRPRKAPRKLTSHGPLLARELPGETPPSIAAWRRLIDATAEYAALEPWTALGDLQPILVAAPGGGEWHTCIVIGSLAQSFGLKVFTGASGWDSFRRVMDSEEPDYTELIGAETALTLELLDLSEADAIDRRILKECGLPAGRAAAGPQFRAKRFGEFPWYLNAAEAALLTHCLSAVVGFLATLVAERAGDPWRDSGVYPLVTADIDKASVSYELFRAPEPEPPSAAPPQLDTQHIERILRAGLPVEGVLETDAFWFPVPIGTSGGRKKMGRAVLSVDAASGQVVDTNMEDAAVAPQAGIAASILRACESSGRIPQAIHVRRPELAQALHSLALALGSRIETRATLPGLGEARAALLDQFGISS